MTAVQTTFLKTITDVLGTELPVTHYYGDGSYDCPHCHYPVRADEGLDLRKHNPWCIAHPDYPVDKAREFIAERERKEREIAERKRNHELSMQRIEEWNRTQAAERTAKLEDAQAKGYCVPCLVHSHFRKQVKHRKSCPLSR